MVNVMKSFVGISVLMGFFFTIIVFIGFDNFESELILNDDEQEGLDEQIVINFSHVVAENTPKGLAAQMFAELVEEKTDGRVKVEVFPNGVLYSDNDELNALLRGEVEMIAPAFSKVTSLEPEWQVLDLPFIFKDYEHVEAVLKGEVGTNLLDKLKEQNMKGLAFWSNGFKQMTSNQGPLRKPEDFQGQRFRIMKSKTLEDQFRMLGVKTNVMPFNQVYRNLEIRYLDGQENTISNIYSKRFYKVQQYLTLSNHGYLGYAVLMNQEFWDRLPNDIQEQIQEAMDETTDWLFEHSIDINKQQLNAIKKSSTIQIYELTEEEREKWIEFFQPLYQAHEERFGGKWIRRIQEEQ